jgi:hypothetical protein
MKINMPNQFIIIASGSLFVVLAIFCAVFSFIIKGIIARHGYEVTYLFTQPVYEYKILKVIEKEKNKYQLLRKAYFVLNISFLAVTIILFILFFVNL